MATQDRIEITLHGSNGSRITEVSAKGFTTRHVATPREAVPSIFSPVDTPAVDTPAITPEPVIEPTTPVETPIGDRMTDLIAEVDSLLTADAEPETEPDAKQQRTPGLWDENGSPVMAVANADNFLECQELAINPTHRDWYNASMNAAHRAARRCDSMHDCIKYVVIAAHCLNIANRLEAEVC